MALTTCPSSSICATECFSMAVLAALRWCVACSDKGSVAEWLGEGGRKMAQSDMEAPDLVHVRTMTYDLECNWKVFNDNYLVCSVTGWSMTRGTFELRLLEQLTGHPAPAL